ncbi:MAG: Crp/Fnr family transcriptional regulator [Bellilinea sp.]
MATIEKVLASSPIFNKLPPAKLSKLANAAVRRRFQKGEVFSLYGDVWPYLFVIEKGEVSAYKQSMEGRNLIVTTFSPGDIFWGMAFFYDQMPQPVSLMAETETVIHQWPIDFLRPMFQEEAALSWELARLMIMRMLTASEILEEIAFLPVAGRLAKLLMEFKPAKPEETLSRSLTLDDMAARIGSTREMVCRFLHRFADDGIIDITRTEFRIADPERLSDLSKYSKG